MHDDLVALGNLITTKAAVFRIVNKFKDHYEAGGNALVQAYGGFTRMTKFCKSCVPKELRSRLEAGGVAD